MPVSSLLIGSLMGGGGGGQSAANIAGGLLGGITGFFQRRKAKKELSKLIQPTYSIPQEILRNQKMAEQAANEGMPSQQYNNAMKNIQRTQSNLLAGATDRRSSLMALPKLQQQSNDATGNLDAQDATMRMQNQRQLYGINNTVAQFRDKEFQLNQLNPYNEKKQYYNSLLGAGNQNMLGGADKLLGGVAGAVFGGRDNGWMNSSGKSYGSNGKAKTNAPGYYNGYGANSTYGDIINPYE